MVPPTSFLFFPGVPSDPTIPVTKGFSLSSNQISLFLPHLVFLECPPPLHQLTSFYSTETPPPWSLPSSDNCNPSEHVQFIWYKQCNCFVPSLVFVSFGLALSLLTDFCKHTFFFSSQMYFSQFQTLEMSHGTKRTGNQQYVNLKRPSSCFTKPTSILINQANILA